MSVQNAAWDGVLSDLRKQFDDSTMDLWLQPLRLLHLSEKDVVISAPNRYLCDVVEKNYSSAIRSSLHKHCPFSGTLRFVTQQQSTDKPDTTATVTQPSEQRSGRQRIARYTFERFVVFEGNALAYEAARHVAETTDDLYNPLLLFGPTGCGKSHLLHAIRRRMARGRQGVMMLTGESFLHRFRMALKQRQVDSFRERFRSVHGLILDDLQFLSNKRMAQQELLYTVDALLDKGSRIILAGTTKPGELTGFHRGLLNRLQAGLLVELPSPNTEARLAMIREKLHHAGFSLPAEVHMAMASRLRGNVRDLEGFIARLDAYTRLTGSSIGLRDFEILLRDFTAPELRARPKLDTVVQEVCHSLDLDPALLLSPKRTRSLTEPRRIAMYLARKLCGLSSKEIGQRFSGRSHSAVLTAEKAIQKQLQSDFELQQRIHDLIDRIRRGPAA